MLMGCTSDGKYNYKKAKNIFCTNIYQEVFTRESIEMILHKYIAFNNALPYDICGMWKHVLHNR